MAFFQFDVIARIVGPAIQDVIEHVCVTDGKLVGDLVATIRHPATFVYFDDVADTALGDYPFDTPVRKRLTFGVRHGRNQHVLGADGIEIVRGFQLQVTTTYQQPEFKDFRFSFGGEDFDFSGNQVRRIPEFIFSFKPSYRTGPFMIFASWFHADDRFVDDANTITLPKYDVIDAGIAYDVGRALRLELWGNNLGNEIGLTEGNPRTGQIVGIQEDIYMARPILGRSWRLGATYKF